MKQNQNLFKIPEYIVDVKSNPIQEMQWGLKYLNIPKLWTNYTGKGITICILDSGIQFHKDLDQAIIKEKCRDFTTDNNIIDNTCFHGIFVAGIIGARNNEFGCVGIAPDCKIISVKVLNNQGSGLTSWVNKGLEYAVELAKNKEIQIINLSLGSNTMDIKQQSLISELYKLNVVVFAAVGNSGPTKNTIGFPALFKETLSIAAMDKNGKIADYSSRGNRIDFAFPGTDIFSCWNNNSYVTGSGSSFACPCAAGICALLLEKHRIQKEKTGKSDCFTVEDVRSHFKKYAIDLDTPGFDFNSGWGCVDVDKMISNNCNNSQLPTSNLPIAKNKNLLQKLINKIKNWFSIGQ